MGGEIAGTAPHYLWHEGGWHARACHHCRVLAPFVSVMSNSFWPSYSQHLDVTKQEWPHRACGAVAVAIMLDGLSQKTVATPDELIDRGVEIGAYKEGIGWYHRGLAELARAYGYAGENYDWSKEDDAYARERLGEFLLTGPVIASMRSGFSSAFGHLIVLRSLAGGTALLHDPQCTPRDRVEQTIPEGRFFEYWSKRIIVIRQSGYTEPAQEKGR